MLENLIPGSVDRTSLSRGVIRIVIWRDVNATTGLSFRFELILFSGARRTK